MQGRCYKCPLLWTPQAQRCSVPSTRGNAGMAGRGGWGGEMETYDGPAWRLISTLCGESATRNLANRSMHIQDLYVGPFPIPRFIKE